MIVSKIITTKTGADITEAYISYLGTYNFLNVCIECKCRQIGKCLFIYTSFIYSELINSV